MWCIVDKLIKLTILHNYTLLRYKFGIMAYFFINKHGKMVTMSRNASKSSCFPAKTTHFQFNFYFPHEVCLVTCDKKIKNKSSGRCKIKINKSNLGQRSDVGKDCDFAMSILCGKNRRHAPANLRATDQLTVLRIESLLEMRYRI